MKKNKNRIYLLALLPFIVVTFLFELIPLIMIIFNSFMPEGSFGFTLEHYKDIFTKALGAVYGSQETRFNLSNT